MSQNTRRIAPNFGPQSTVARNHRRKLRRQLIGRLIDQLCELHDRLAPGDPQRDLLRRKIGKWNVEFQAED
jgi:hypothetical protein